MAEVRMMRLEEGESVLICNGCKEGFDVDPETDLMAFIDQAKAFIRLHKPCPESHGARRG